MIAAFSPSKRPWPKVAPRHRSEVRRHDAQVARQRRGYPDVGSPARLRRIQILHLYLHPIS
jgi:hypothetical protein